MERIIKQRCQLERREFLKTIGGTILAAPLSSVYASSVRQLALSSGALGRMAIPVSAANEADWATVSALLDYSSHTYTKTWDDATCRTLHKGAYLGNGDFGAHLGGTIHSLKYYLGKNIAIRPQPFTRRSLKRVTSSRDLLHSD